MLDEVHWRLKSARHGWTMGLIKLPPGLSSMLRPDVSAVRMRGQTRAAERVSGRAKIPASIAPAFAVSH